jgi:hypothetical protein
MYELSFSYAKELIHEADVLLYRGRSWQSFFIGRAGQTTYTHAGLASWVNGHADTDAILETVEFKEGKGGRSVNLERTIQENPGIIDVYRPIPIWHKWKFNVDELVPRLETKEFNGKAVTRTMRRLTGLPYGWRRIWWIAKQKMVGLRLWYSPNDLMVDEVSDIVYPVCSTAVAYSFNKNGFDLLNNRSDEWTEPGHIANSTRLSYLFTLVP